MEHKIIKTENYLLVVSDDKIKEDDYALLNKKTHLEIQKALPSCLKNSFKNAECWNVENEVHEAGHKKIIAHLPLNGVPYLEGVDVLPKIEDEVYKLSTEFCIKKEGRPKDLTIGFIEGYNKAKETYKYTLEDVINIAEYCRNPSDGLMRTKDLVKEYFLELNNQQEETIQVTCFQCGGSGKRTVSTTYPNEASCFICSGSGHQTKSVMINQLKLPIAFECEVKEYGQYDCGVFMKDDEELEKITNSEGRTQWVGTYIY